VGELVDFRALKPLAKVKNFVLGCTIATYFLVRPVYLENYFFHFIYTNISSSIHYDYMRSITPGEALRGKMEEWVLSSLQI
jgi:hypothetical protein